MALIPHRIAGTVETRIACSQAGEMERFRYSQFIIICDIPILFVLMGFSGQSHGISFIELIRSTSFSLQIGNGITWTRVYIPVFKQGAV